MVSADDAWYSLHDEGAAALLSLGATKLQSMYFRSGFYLVARKNKGVIAEDLAPATTNSKGDLMWAPAIVSQVCVPLEPPVVSVLEQRRRFCELYDGYGDFCEASTFAQPIIPPQLDWKTSHAQTHTATSIPIVVIAGNRYRYLLQLLQSLFRQPGLSPHLVCVMFDGGGAEGIALVELFGVRHFSFTKAVTTSQLEETFQRADVVAIHYKRSLDALWLAYPQATMAIVLEEDLVVGSDFLAYFSQTMHLLERDTTLLTISAWNDHGYKHSSSNSSMLYRTDIFPGLGWLLTKKLWLELGPAWPPCCDGWSWDLWIRENGQNGREAIYPDVSRTFHVCSCESNT